RQRTRRRQKLGEVASLEKIHGDVEPAVVELPQVEHVDDVRMLDATSADRLAMEANDHVRTLRVLGLQNLQGDLLFDCFLHASINVAHAPFAELPQDAIAPGDELPDERVSYIAGRCVRERRRAELDRL